MLQLAPLGAEDMHAFAVERGIAASDRRLGLAAGRPGVAVTLVDAAGETPLPLMSKRDLAARILDRVEARLGQE